MVTARMPSGKKAAGNAVLARMGTNASQAVNQLYDYLIANQTLPFPSETSFDRTERLAEARSWIDELSRQDVDQRFGSMCDDDIRRERLERQNLMGGDER
ncbi:MAG: type II toxin-antitoxin system RelB/DinJ family antitoxin [Atopobiaceae bacterium]|nr:type II toxin-antitoxin system RelB/DinJ family antitoxin [Atopobiaceae bacterium]